jgi:hypothetical protein
MSAKDRYILFVALGIVIVALIIDTSIVKVYRFITPPLSPESDLLTFILTAFVFGAVQYLLLRRVRDYADISGFKIMNKLILISQSALTLIISTVIIQMIAVSFYSSYLILVAIAISYTLAIVMTGALSIRFYSWFRSSRNVVILTYGLAAASLSINSAITIIYVSNGLLSMPTNVGPHIGHFTSYSPYSGLLNVSYIISYIISFAIMWFATILLLHHHSKRIGAIKYWILVSIPLVYFLGQFHPLLLDVLSDYRSSSPILFNVLYTLIFSLSKPIGGVLFGLVFWILAKSVPRSRLTDYMMFAGFGVLLFFISNQAVVLINLPYPPFGMVTISFVGLSSFLMMIGIFASAVSVAEDSRLRISIRKLTIQESKLIDHIGSAQMELEVQKKVIELTRRTKGLMSAQTGVDPSVSDEDMKTYVQDVLAELKKKPDPGPQ